MNVDLAVFDDSNAVALVLEEPVTDRVVQVVLVRQYGQLFLSLQHDSNGLLLESPVDESLRPALEAATQIAIVHLKPDGKIAEQFTVPLIQG